MVKAIGRKKKIMMKKTIFFVLCLAPLGVRAADVQYVDPGVNGNYDITGGLTATDATYVFQGAGNAIVADTGGITVGQNLYIGRDYQGGDDTGFVYVTSAADKTFELQSSGAISVTGALEIADGFTLNVKAPDTATPDSVNMTFGSIDANGALVVEDASTFTSNGAVDVANGLTVTANVMNTGMINVTGGDTSLTIDNGLEIGGLVDTGTGTVSITAGSIVSNGDIQNALADGVSGTPGAMDFTVGGVFNIAGSLENTGTMTVKNSGDGTGGLIVKGAVVNSGDKMDLNLDALDVSGIPPQGDASFINGGDLNVVVSGATDIAYGFDLSTMDVDDAFSFETDTLTFSQASTDAWTHLLSNKLNQFELLVHDGQLTVGAIDNGQTDENVVNTGANMTVTVMDIVAESVINNGTALNLTTWDDAGASIVINGAVIENGAVANASTTITSTGVLTVNGDVSNLGTGTMALTGNTVTLAGVTNTGRSLKILAPTDEDGKISIKGSVLNGVAQSGDNASELLINARGITIDGSFTNESGIATIDGSDSPTAATGSSMAISGAFAVNGGVVNLRALAGSVDMKNGLAVANGATLNVSGATDNINVTGAATIADNITVGGGANGAGMNLQHSGSATTLAATSIDVGGSVLNVNTSGADTAYGAVLASDLIDIDGNVQVSGQGRSLVFGLSGDQGTGNTGTLTVGQDFVVGAGASATIYSAVTNVRTLDSESGLIVYGNQINADGRVNIGGGIWMDGTSPASGMVVRGDVLTISADTSDAADDAAYLGGMDINGAVSVGEGKTLNLNAGEQLTVSGLVINAGNLALETQGTATFDYQISNGKASATGQGQSGVLSVTANAINAQAINNMATATFVAVGDIVAGAVTNSDDMTMESTNGMIKTGAVTAQAGTLTMNADTVVLGNLTVGDSSAPATSAMINTTASTITLDGYANIYAGMRQGAGAGSSGLNLLATSPITFTATALSVGGDFDASGNSATYNLGGALNITGGVNIAQGASSVFNIGTTASVGDINNSGTLVLDADNGITIAQSGGIQNAGDLTLDSGAGVLTVNTFDMTGTANTGVITLAGAGLTTTQADAQFVGNILYQGADVDELGAGAVNVLAGASDYIVTTSGVTLDGIIQTDGGMTFNTSSVNIGSDGITATNLRFAANPDTNWLNVSVDGNVSGGVEFIGLKEMTIGQNYIFDNNSSLNAAILPYATSSGGDAGDVRNPNYWATVSLNNDNTLGVITNADNGAAMIEVGGQFVSNVSGFGTHSDNTPLKLGQVGIDLFDTVDQGTAIWLVHADDGIREVGDKIRNLNVNFCNADGSICFNYLDSLKANDEIGSNFNGSDTDLPAYLSMRDTDGDGIEDSIYIVFDPRFGGPVEVFRIQPIVERTVPHTDGEYVSAGALDNLVAGQLQNTGFYNDTPIEAIPVIFDGTNLELAANELYDRMEYYNTSRDGTSLARFSRLFQPRELEQIAGSIALNEHTNFRSFEDRMFDEFIWNRNRNLSKGWVDVDFGMFTQDVSDGKRVDGNRFSVSGGFDWQNSETVILGLTAHVSNMSSENIDSMNLGYMPGSTIAGNVNVDVENTNIGVGGYMMKILGEKTRLYGNAFLDMHLFDITRSQNFVDTISGDGTAFSLISEWGLMHDWLNQYIVGNAYARVGYNFGFSVTEQAAGQDYMDMKSDGYFMLTPGYSLIAQKRIYPSAWFQIRPYASIGIEYDVFGAPDYVRYKFALAHDYTRYDVDLDPLWANIGGGIEMLSANGFQMGIDYRYQYNDVIQLHNIRVSGSYRF